MLTDASLTRLTSRLSSYIQKYVTLAGTEKREEVLDLFEKMNLLFPHWVIMTCPVMHPDIRYVSRNSNIIFGNDSVDLNDREINKYFAGVHIDDRPDLRNCFAFVHDFLEAIPSELHHQYRSVLHYRFRKADGQYMYIHDEKATLQLTGSGNLYFALFRDITDDKNFTRVKAEIFKQDHRLVKVAEYKPSAEGKTLSKREGELVTLMKMGLSTKEIAGHLNISHNTVRNLKSRMFEKYNVSNSIELLNMTA